jgi:hypothetical protein
MSLHVVARLLGRDVAEAAAQRMEFGWHQDANDDPFARLYGLA